MASYYPVTTERGLNDTIKIVDALKAKGSDGKILTSAQISTLTGIYPNRIKGLLKEEMKVNPNIISIPRKGYRWVMKPEKKIERYDDTKNNEGYTDMTAYLAMKAVIDDSFKQEPGTVWETDRKPYLNEYETNMAVVLMPYKGAVSCLEVRKIDNWYDPDIMCTFSWKGILYYVDPRRIIQRPIKWFERSIMRLGDAEFEEMKNKIGRHLDCLTMVDHKTVEVVKEVPAAITEEQAVRFLEDSGWMKTHETEVVNQYCAVISEESAIEVLKDSGWLDRHDNEISKSEREIAEDVVDSTIHTLKMQLAEAQAARDAYRESLHLICGDKKLGGFDR